MPKTICAGVDPSLSNTVVAIIKKGVPVFKSFEATKYKSDYLCHRHERYAQLAGEILAYLSSEKVTHVSVEGYASNAKNNAVRMVESGCILRAALLKVYGVSNVLEVAPMNLKKFVTGKGNASKLLMVQRVAKKYDIELKSDDEADATGLADLCECVFGGKEATNAKQREAVIASKESLRV